MICQWLKLDSHSQVNFCTCNILTYITSVNTWTSGDSPLSQLVKELELCLFLSVIQRYLDQVSTGTINNYSTVHGGDAG